MAPLALACDSVRLRCLAAAVTVSCAVWACGGHRPGGPADSPVSRTPIAFDQHSSSCRSLEAFRVNAPVPCPADVVADEVPPSWFGGPPPGPVRDARGVVWRTLRECTVSRDALAAVERDARNRAEDQAGQPLRILASFCETGRDDAPATRKRTCCVLLGHPAVGEVGVPADVASGFPRSARIRACLAGTVLCREGEAKRCIRDALGASLIQMGSRLDETARRLRTQSFRQFSPILDCRATCWCERDPERPDACSCCLEGEGVTDLAPLVD